MDPVILPLKSPDEPAAASRRAGSNAERPGDAATPPSTRRDAGAASALVAGSHQMLGALDTALRVADSTATVLLCGESGTGKELLARAIHEYSGRARGAFVAVNCAAMPEPLLESELFGHERGSFTGAARRRTGRVERASGGTLFLDEVGDMSLGLQAKILRTLEEHEVERVGGDAPVRVDVRVIAATNRDLRADIRCGRFREDLYYRLAVVVVGLPPLRQRGADLELLTRHFIAQYASQYGRPAREPSEESWAIIRRYPWPGNVRELRNAMERAVLLAEEETIRPAHLPAEISDASRAPGAEGDSYPITLKELERRHISRVLAMTAGNRVRCAEILGIHRNTLRKKLREHRLG